MLMNERQRQSVQQPWQPCVLGMRHGMLGQRQSVLGMRHGMLNESDWRTQSGNERQNGSESGDEYGGAY